MRIILYIFVFILDIFVIQLFTSVSCEDKPCPRGDRMVPTPCKDECATDADCIDSAICCTGGCLKEDLENADDKEYYKTCMNPDDCSTDVCKNGGICTGSFGGYTCFCQPGFHGKDCQLDTNECLSFPCQGGGECEDLVNDYICCCPPELTGKNCEFEVKCKSKSKKIPPSQAKCSAFPKAIYVIKQFFYIKDENGKHIDVTEWCHNP